MKVQGHIEGVNDATIMAIIREVGLAGMNFVWAQLWNSGTSMAMQREPERSGARRSQMHNRTTQNAEYRRAMLGQADL